MPKTYTDLRRDTDLIPNVQDLQKLTEPSDIPSFYGYNELTPNYRDSRAKPYNCSSRQRF